jgi:hypothetical protein
MSSPAAVIYERTRAWRPVLAGGSEVREKFVAGRATVSIIIRPGVTGNLETGLRTLEQRLVAAANAAQVPGVKIEVKVEPLETLGLAAAAEVLGPAA